MTSDHKVKINEIANEMFQIARDLGFHREERVASQLTMLLSWRSWLQDYDAQGEIWLNPLTQLEMVRALLHLKITTSWRKLTFPWLRLV